MSAVDDVVQRIARTTARFDRRTWLAIGLGVPLLAIGWWFIDAFLGFQGVYGIGLLVSAGVAVYVATALRAELHRSERNAAELMDAYVQTQHELAELDRTYRGRLHDARSAAASVRGAVQLLSHRVGAQRAQDRELQRLVTTELERMHALLDGGTSEPLTDFDLAEVLEPILLSHRVTGTAIGSALRPVITRGRPMATASVLDNLLRNAAVHAPGARVEVRMSVGDEFASVIVDDDGPGIPADECERVLQAGVRGSAASAPGSGLGLHTAATAIREQAGALEVLPRPGGGTRVRFTLPIAAPWPQLRLVRRLAG